MSARIAHRGPDDEGTWVDPEAGVALGFRRLAIIDLSENGHQPMRSPSGRFTIVFNGEVYNHHLLRRQLEAEGFRFRGHSDTEVIVAAFEHWGVRAAVGRFIGMFAIAAWDAQHRRLLLIRDRLGIKPLFYTTRPGVVAFGSELKALVAAPGFDPALDPDAVSAYLRYLYVPAPATIYRNVRKLLPGHILEISDPMAPLPEPVPYWRLDEVARAGMRDPSTASDEEARVELESLIMDAVRLRMQADVPLGALLSGGIDSSVVVAAMQASSSRATKTYSIGFTERDHNEAHHAARVADYLGTEHTELMLTDEDARSVVPHLPDLFDEPFADPSQIPTYLVCRLARQEVIVALTGDGGDEVFGGYNRYVQGERIISRLSKIPSPLRRVAAAAAGSVAPRSWDRTYRALSPIVPGRHRHRLPGEKIAKLASLLRWGSEADMYRSLLSAWQEPERIVTGSHRRTRGYVEEVFDRSQELPLLERMILTDQATYLADDLLAKVDRASMAVSLEARVPLLDHRIVEYGWRLPRHQKIRNGEGKWILRQILYGMVPRELVDRPKMGFSVPIAAWLQGALKPWAEDLLFSVSTHGEETLRMDAIRQDWDAFQRGRTDLALGLWAVLMLRAWHRRWVG